MSFASLNAYGVATWLSVEKFCIPLEGLILTVLETGGLYGSGVMVNAVSKRKSQIVSYVLSMNREHGSIIVFPLLA